MATNADDLFARGAPDVDADELFAKGEPDEADQLFEAARAAQTHFEPPAPVAPPETTLRSLGEEALSAAKGAGAGLVTGAVAPFGAAPAVEKSFAGTKAESPVAFPFFERLGQLGTYAALARLGGKFAPKAPAPAITYIARETPEAVGSAIETASRGGSLADALKAAGISYAVPGAAAGVSKAGKTIATTPLPKPVTSILEKVPLLEPATGLAQKAVGRTLQATPTVGGAFVAPAVTAMQAESLPEAAASLVDLGRGVTAATRGAAGKFYESEAQKLPPQKARAEAELLEKIRKPISEAEIGLQEAKTAVAREGEREALDAAQTKLNLDRRIEDLQQRRTSEAAETRAAATAQLEDIQRKRNNLDTDAFRKYQQTANSDFIKAVQLQNKVNKQLEALINSRQGLAQKYAAQIAALQAEKDKAWKSAKAEISQMHGEMGGRVLDLSAMDQKLGTEGAQQFIPDLEQIYQRRLDYTEPKMQVLRSYWLDPEGTLAAMSAKKTADLDDQINRLTAMVEEKSILSPEERAQLKRDLESSGVSKLSDEEHAQIAARFGLKLPPTAFEALRNNDLRFKTERVGGRLGGLVLPTEQAQKEIDLEAKQKLVKGKLEAAAPEQVTKEVEAERAKALARMEEDAKLRDKYLRSPSAVRVAEAAAQRKLEAAKPQPISTLRPATEAERVMADLEKERAKRRVEGLSGVVKAPGEEAGRRFDLETLRPVQAALGLSAAKGARIDPRISGKVTGGWLRGILSGDITDPAKARTFLAQTADQAAYNDPAAATQIIGAFERALKRGAKNAAAFRDRATKTNIVRAAIEALSDPEMKELMAQELASPTP